MIAANPPLLHGSRVVTHSPMSNTRTTNILLVLVLAAMLGGFFLYTASENRAAVRAGDYSRCWSEDCKREISYTRF